MKKILILLLMLIVAGCETRENNRRETIIIKGSDTMVNLTQKWAEVYMKGHDHVSIQVTGGGSGTGVAALLNGTANIANISRELKAKEIEKAEKAGVVPEQHKVALDGIAIVVNPENPVDTLTLDQAGDIFSGKVENWSKFGGPDLEIVLYGRENSSGTYEYFRKTVLKGEAETGTQRDFSTSTQVLQGTAALGEAVARDKRGIGYGGVGYFANRKDLKVIYIKNNKTGHAVSPLGSNGVNLTVIRNGQYPLSRYLYSYTDGKPQGEVAEYINFITSEAGQRIVKDMEYIPLHPVKD